MATFAIGEEMSPIPMTESGSGTYLGKLRVSASHDFKRETLTVRLLSRELQASTMKVIDPPISTLESP
ncbi:MAG: hypothetical protein JKY65_19605 [Planctomycetes bacterium]|nr:hypothetical protein [Planctomycetota bacterium]